MNKKVIILGIGIMGVGYFLNSIHSDRKLPIADSNRADFRSKIPIENDVRLVNAREPSNVLESQIPDSGLTREQIKTDLGNQGFVNVEVSEDPDGGFSFVAESEPADVAAIKERMKNQWNKDEREILKKINGRDVKLTQSDREAILYFKSIVGNE